MTTAPKKWTKEEIRFKVETDNTWLIRGLLAIFDRQTDDEKNDEITKHENNIGFSGCDANILTSFAKHYKEHGWLSKKQIEICRKKMLKYCGQLAKVANKEI